MIKKYDGKMPEEPRILFDTLHWIHKEILLHMQEYQLEDKIKADHFD